MVGIIAIIVFLVLLFLGLPIAFVIAWVTVLGLYLLDVPLISVAQKMYSGLDSFVILAVPLFLLAANLMNAGKISDMLVRMSIGLVGHIRGGLGHANVVVSMFFAGVSGSSSADVAGIGSILIPSMIKEGFSKETSVAVTASSATIGNIIPPSIFMVVYGSLANCSVGALFLAGFIPGVLVGFAQMTVLYVISIRHGYPRHPRMRLKEILFLILKSIPPLFTPVLILGGIIGGFVTPTEAAVLACVYAFFISMFWYKTLKWSELPRVFQDTVRLASLALFALSTAGALGELLSYYQVSKIVSHFFSTYLPNINIFLALVILFLLFIGCFLDAIPAMILFVPVMLPAAKAFGIHDIHMGIVVVLCMAIGLVTPPYGMCLLLASSIADLPISRAATASIPYILAILAVTLLVTFIPDVALFIPKIIRPDWFGIK
jgi:tripartite ATP-independent transporter DctM subunit